MKNAESPELYTENETEQPSAADGEQQPTSSDVASRAYDLWQQRGCPEGSAEEDWLEAERELGPRDVTVEP